MGYIRNFDASLMVRRHLLKMLVVSIQLARVRHHLSHQVRAFSLTGTNLEVETSLIAPYMHIPTGRKNKPVFFIAPGKSRDLKLVAIKDQCGGGTTAHAHARQ